MPYILSKIQPPQLVKICTGKGTSETQHIAFWFIGECLCHQEERTSNLEINEEPNPLHILESLLEEV